MSTRRAPASRAFSKTYGIPIGDVFTDLDVAITTYRFAVSEVIPQAMAVNPVFFKTIYADLLNAKKTRTSVQAALDAGHSAGLRVEAICPFARAYLRRQSASKS